MRIIVISSIIIIINYQKSIRFFLILSCQLEVGFWNIFPELLALCAALFHNLYLRKIHSNIYYLAPGSST